MATTTFDLRSLAGIAPGLTPRSAIRERLGSPEKEWITAPSKVFDDELGGNLVWEYPSHGVSVLFDRADLSCEDPVVDEVTISAPFNEAIPCGLHLGQPLAEAREIIVEHFNIENEYEDAIYFVPSTAGGLLAGIENGDTDHVLSIELMRTTDEWKRKCK